MARDYVIRVQGALRTERGLLSVERELAEELREATRKAQTLLMAAAINAAPTPDAHTGEEQGEGIESDINFPEAHGGLRRFAGRAPGGEPLVSLTYQVSLFIPEGTETQSARHETGTGLYGPLAAKFPIYPSAGKALLLTGGPQSASGHWIGNQNTIFKGGAGGGNPDNLPIFDHVMHPGMAPRPFLERTVRDHDDEIDRLYEHAVDSAVRGI